jgi:hypothetical protein
VRTVHLAEILASTEGPPGVPDRDLAGTSVPSGLVP